jgi:hypothetical protein
VKQGLRSTIVTWADQRIADMLAAPRMWGSDEAIEMQTLLLLELRALATRPEPELANPRRILDAYAAYLQKSYPDRLHRPLFQLVEPDDLGLSLARELQNFVDVFRLDMMQDNPFQHSDVADHERRLVDVIGSTTKGEPFETQDEIRGIDLDRGLVILGKKERLTCYVRREQLGSVALVGVQAHVRGSLFRPLTGRPFVLAEAIDFSDSPEEE